MTSYDGSSRQNLLITNQKPGKQIKKMIYGHSISVKIKETVNTLEGFPPRILKVTSYEPHCFSDGRSFFTAWLVIAKNSANLESLLVCSEGLFTGNECLSVGIRGGSRVVMGT